MQLITKFFLFILSSLCLFFLVFFTFIAPGIDSTINIDYEYTQTGTYLIQSDESDYSLLAIDETINNNTDIKMQNISLGNNIFYITGAIEEIGTNEIHLSEGLYYFDINSLDFNKQIFIEGAKISSQAPGDFIINTNKTSHKSIYSISSKIEVRLIPLNDDKSTGTLLDIYPNMYVMYDPQFNTQIINADLLRIQNVQDLGIINSPLYTKIRDEGGNEIFELHEDIKKYVFYENESNFNFIKDIFSFNNYQEKIYKKNFITLTQNNFYKFPGEKYIIKYYNYFQNKEKQKVYYKNIILKELVSIINTKDNTDPKNINIIIENINILKEQHPEDYQKIMQTINHYYENILYSQYASSTLLLQFSKFYHKLHDQETEFKYSSLLSLRNIYTRYHNDNIVDFHKLLNMFIDQHQIEMNMSIYDENHRIHNYFLFFLKNILIADFSKGEDHNDIVLLFKKYIDIQSVFIEKGNDVTKKTALFDNAELLKVFVNITKINFFQEKLDDKGLLVLLKPAKITNENYKILYENLNKLLDFHTQYQYFIDNSTNRKDTILKLSYNKYTEDLKEYFLAIEDYNQYILQYDSAIINPDFNVEEVKGLQIEDAKTYLKQFIGVSSLHTNIEVRDYGYCTQPIEINDVPVTNKQDGYCYKVTNLIISGFNFGFILNPSDNNTISNLSYTDLEGKTFNVSTNYVMDKIEEDMLRKYAAAQSKEKDRYDFSRFFINTFINIEEFSIEDDGDNDGDDTEFIPPNSDGDSLQIRKLKQALLGKNSFLEKIREILPITYDYLIITRENDEYIVNIFPIDFEISITDGIMINQFKGKFSGIYSYGSLENENTFKDVSLLLNNNKVSNKNVYLLNKTPIHINGEFMTKDVNNLITKVLYPFSKIEDIYSHLYEKYPKETITLTYNIGQNNIDFEVSNGYNYFYDMNELVEIHKNNNKLLSIPDNKILNYLNALP